MADQEEYGMFPFVRRRIGHGSTNLASLGIRSFRQSPSSKKI
jgi:hypothetical protein